MTSVKLCVSVNPPAEANTVNVKLPEFAGTPEIVPVVEPSERPEGSAPLITYQLTSPEFAANV